MLADGRVRLTELSGWRCGQGPQPGTFTGEGSWTIERHSDEDPGILILIKFTADGTPAVQTCDGWFTLHGTGMGGHRRRRQRRVGLVHGQLRTWQGAVPAYPYRVIRSSPA